MRRADPGREAESIPERVLRLEPRVGWIVGFVALIWTVELVNTLFGHRLTALGLNPRTLAGLPGILFVPFLHNGIGHALANTIPFVILGSLVLLRGARTFVELSLFILVVGGVAVWLVGRPAVHVGASGLVMGYFGFLLARGWYERTVLAIAIAAVVLLLYGGALWGLLPLVPGMSWEMHLFGFLAGVLAARILPADETPPARSST